MVCQLFTLLNHLFWLESRPPCYLDVMILKCYLVDLIFDAVSVPSRDIGILVIYAVSRGNAMFKRYSYMNSILT